MSADTQALAPDRTATAKDPRLRRGPRGHPLLPGGIGRSTFAVGRPLPYVLRGEGCRVHDDQGNELIDANNNFTAMIHGHAHPEIVEAATKAVRDGSCFGLPNVYEWEHADLMLQRFPSLDQIRYTNSGTEAVMTAVRVARAATGRPGCIVVRDSYHGTSDFALSTGDATTRGVPAGVLQDVTRIEPNDAEGLQAAIEREPEKYAAIVIDLLPGRLGLVKVEEHIAELARTLADRHGIVLIVDEVISLRLAFGGLSGEYGMDPDMVTVGKIIGGGFAVGAVIGKEQVMRELDPSSPNGLQHGGTFSANPVTLAAGAVSLRLLSPAAITRLNGFGDQLEAQIGETLAEVNWRLRTRGSLLRPTPPGAASKEIYRRLFWAAYERGLLMTPHGVIALSTPMDEEVVSQVGDRLADAVLAVASGADEA